MTAQPPGDFLPPMLARMTRAPAGGSLVFCPDIGGNVIYARPLAMALAGEASCFGLRIAPDMLERLGTLSIENIAARFAADTASAALPRPLHVIGFSFAGYFAYEMSRALSALGSPPDRLWILDVRPERRIGAADILRDPVHHLGYAAKYAWKNRRRLLGLGADPAILHRYGVLRIDLSRHPDSYRGIIRHFYEAFPQYRPRPWEGRATVLVASGNPRMRGVPADLGWSRLIGGGVEAIAVPGDHLGMLREPQNAAVIAGHLRARLTLTPSVDLAL